MGTLTSRAKSSVCATVSVAKWVSSSNQKRFGLKVWGEGTFCVVDGFSAVEFCERFGIDAAVLDVSVNGSIPLPLI